MDDVKDISGPETFSRSDIIGKRIYVPLSSASVGREDSSRRSSFSGPMDNEDSRSLLPSSNKNDVPGLFRRLFAIFISAFSSRTLIIFILASTSVLSVLYFMGIATVKFPNQGRFNPASIKSSNLIAFEKPCGNSSDEARARGCRFDVMAFLWLPEQCYDQSLIDSFLNLHEWQYFQDKKLSMPVSLQEAMSGEYHLLYVTHEYHVRHCTLLWRKMHRALLSPLGLAAVDGYMASYAHTLHCEHMLIDWRDRSFKLINTGLVRQFPSCGMFVR